ncbi:dockerin type I domain-containing protein [Candidatus Poribacteria bacterium]
MRHITVVVLVLSSFAFLCSFPAPVLPANIVKIGNPGLEQFPRNDTDDCYARAVWDMQYYNGSIYVGVGDYERNRGPIDVWSFDAYSYFKKEYTVDEEKVSIFRNYDGKLFIPGMDTTETRYGNLYIKEGDTWEKLGTIFGAFHVWDVAVFEGNIYVIMNTPGRSVVMESTDIGHSWQSLITATWANTEFFYGMVSLGDSLAILGTTSIWRDCVYRYMNGNVEKSVISNSSELQNTWNPYRLIGFRDGLLYIGGYAAAYAQQESSLLFWSDPSSGVVTAIEKFEGKNIRDIIAQDSICYVLTASEMDDAFQGAIYSSSDLENWVEVAVFPTPALPYSFELLDGTFYVGLGNRSPREGFADTESGSIYRINQDESSPIVNLDPPPWDINKDGVINISDLALLSQHFGEHITTPLDPNPDANDDRKVDILDMILVARHLGEISLMAAN